MQRGDFEAAWRVADRVLAERRGQDCSRWPRHLQYIWDGSPVDDQHVFVRCYHGLGDTIQFARLLASLRKRARRVTLWVQPALMELLRNVKGVDALLPLHDGVPDVEFDVDVELMELPQILRLSARDLPGPIPYIKARRTHAVPSAAGAVRVGLTWRSGAWNVSRSIPNRELQSLAEIAHVRWFSLQYPPQEPPFPLVELACRDIPQMAARMQTLDLVLSVDTMTAHLAGALGMRVWTLLTHECDWRWSCERSDSPWYPTMRLFRQRAAGDWAGVMHVVASSLQDETERVIRGRDTRSSGYTASSG